jgi:uncharacterized protein (DUF362 family)
LRQATVQLIALVSGWDSCPARVGQPGFVLLDGVKGSGDMTTSIPMEPGITMLGCNVPARVLLKLHLIRGHPMFVTIDETDWQGLRWRVERPIKSVRLMPVQTVEVEFADETPARQFGAEQMIEVHTVYYVVAPTA